MGRVKMELQLKGLPKILESLFFRSTVTGNINVEALGNNHAPSRHTAAENGRFTA